MALKRHQMEAELFYSTTYLHEHFAIIQCYLFWKPWIRFCK